MTRQITVQLPVADVQRSITFFKSLGFVFNPQFSSEHSACVILGENIFAMLLAAPFFQGLVKKPVADATKSTEVVTCLSCESREEVDTLVAKALAAGGTTPDAAQDHGFMYAHGFEDPDGHAWQMVFMRGAPPTV